VLGAFAALGVALLFIMMGLARQHLVCDPPTDACVLTRLVGGDAQFRMSSLSGVRTDVRSGSRGGKFGVVILSFRDRPPIEMMQTSVERAEEASASISSGIESRQRIDVTLRGYWWMALVGLGAIAMGISMAVSGLERIGRMHLEIIQNGAGLRSWRTVLGIPFAARTTSLEDVTDVTVELGSLEDAWRSRGAEPMVAGRIVLVAKSGEQRPLSTVLYPGHSLHYRAAAQLRRRLGMERLPGGVEEKLETIPLVTTPIGTRIGLAWAGVTTGGLLGLGTFAISGIVLGFITSNEPEAWMLAAGFIPGSIAGLGLVLHATRPHRPR
jgi:hypothetical protein